MAENLQNNYSTTLSSGYTSGAGVLAVTAAPAAGNGTYTMTLIIRDQTTKAIKLLFRVASVSSLNLTGSAEGTDANAASGDLVDAVLSVAALAQIRTDFAPAGTAGCVVDGAGSPPATGSKGFIQVPYAGTITGWTMIADQSGSAQFTIKKSTFSAFPTNSSIVASAQPALSSAQKATSTTLTGWTTSISAGDVLEFNLDSITTCTRVELQVQIKRS